MGGGLGVGRGGKGNMEFEVLKKQGIDEKGAV